MKKILASVLAFMLIFSNVRADEGMWLLPLLQKMNSKAMENLGCRLTPEQIYDINHSSLKDAVVQFGGGCTGELISDKGLLVTNHHCGYSSIQRLSTPEHNYLEDGYWAMNSSEELPVSGLTVTFLESMTDITPVMQKAREAALKEYKDSANVEILADNAGRAALEEVRKSVEAENPGCEVVKVNFYNDNVCYLIIYKVYRDIRFVGAPPASVGKFGGETDNWMWPRHTGDFSMFRVYAGKDNEPADYSKDNVPYVPKRSLAVSLKGVNEGDFSMIMGYPGRTQRYLTADQLQLMLDKQAISIDARTLRQNIMREGMEADPVVRLQYANKYASSSNGWKKWIGERKAFAKLDIIGREEQKEADFMSWVNSGKKRKAAYGDALSLISKGVDETRKATLASTYALESVYTVGTNSLFATFVRDMNLALKANPEDTVSAIRAGRESALALYKDYNEALERKMAAAMLEFYRDKAETSNYLKIGNRDFATMDIDAYVDTLFSTSIFGNKDRLLSTDISSVNQVLADPASELYQAFIKVYFDNYVDYNDDLFRGSKEFAAGLLAWKKGEPVYPDANFTMRLTYGTVKGYSPADAVTYRYYTTLDGVMEKENPEEYEFRVPAKLKELYENKDYGQYADANGKLTVCFLNNCDITGGNSGSPVLDANGNLIGLAFDGNWESMSSDVMFEPELQRCICVDIRYVLFMLDKFGGAGYLLNEMNIVK